MRQFPRVRRHPHPPRIDLALVSLRLQQQGLTSPPSPSPRPRALARARARAIRRWRLYTSPGARRWDHPRPSSRSPSSPHLLVGSHVRALAIVLREVYPLGARQAERADELIVGARGVLGGGERARCPVRLSRVVHLRPPRTQRARALIPFQPAGDANKLMRLQVSDVAALGGLARRLGRAGLGAVLEPPLAEHPSLLRVRLGSAGRDTSADGSRGDRMRAKKRA